jgi:hypothetical protein
MAEVAALVLEQLRDQRVVQVDVVHSMCDGVPAFSRSLTHISPSDS